jgi:hypothetical protein
LRKQAKIGIPFKSCYAHHVSSVIARTGAEETLCHSWLAVQVVDRDRDTPADCHEARDPSQVTAHEGTNIGKEMSKPVFSTLEKVSLANH